MDREAEARKIVAAARAERKPLPRSIWIVALVVSVACTAALAIAWLQDRDTVADKPLTRHAVERSSGLGVGLLLGLGVGIAIGSVFALRRRHSDRSSHSPRNIP